MPSRQLVVGDRAGQHDLAQRVQPRHVRGRVGLGVAQRLSLPQHVAVVLPLRLHGVEHEVGGAVENTAEREDPVALRGDGEVVQEGHAAAAGRREQEGHALLPRKLRQLDPVRRDQRLVRGHDVPARLKGHRDVGVGGLDAAHDLRHRADRGVGENGLHRGDLEIRVLLAGADQNRPRLQPGRVFEHLIDSDADGAKAQYGNFHVFHPL